MLIQGDCAELVEAIEPGSVALVVTSPPYDGLRTYGTGAAFDFDRLARGLYRALKPGGVVVWVVNDQVVKGSETGTSFRQALRFKELGFRLHDTMIFLKRNPVPLPGPRYQPAFEFMFVLSKGRPATVHLLQEPCVGAGDVRKVRRCRAKNSGEDLQVMTGSARPVRPTKPRANAWTYSVGGLAIDHPAVFPLALARDHVLSWSDPGDLVLDPFTGSGTTGVACAQLGRRFLGFDRNPAYLDSAAGRIAAALTQQQDAA